MVLSSLLRMVHRSRPFLRGVGHSRGQRRLASVKVYFQEGADTVVEAEVEEGTSILEAAHANHVELEGACDGELACSTCHVILEEAIFESLEEPGDEEMDMLDMAFGLEETSRLGCQVRVCYRLPAAAVRVRGFYCCSAKAAGSVRAHAPADGKKGSK